MIAPPYMTYSLTFKEREDELKERKLKAQKKKAQESYQKAKKRRK